MKSKVSICISVIGMLLGLFTLWSNILNADLINRITGLIQGEDVLRQALFTLLCIVLIEVLLLVYNMLKSYFVQYDSMRADEYIHDTTYDILSRTKYENIENNSNFMQKLDFINNQGWWRIAQLTVFVQNIVSAVISLAGIFVTLFYINPLIVLILSCRACRGSGYQRNTAMKRIFMSFTVCAKMVYRLSRGAYHGIQQGDPILQPVRLHKKRVENGR